MMRCPMALMLMIAILTLSAPAVAQCCDIPEVYVMSEDIITVTGREIWTGEVFVNGTLIVERDLLLEGATLVVGGAGIRIDEGARLRSRGSTIMSHPNNTGFYMENRGILEIIGSRLIRCSDPDNPMMGIYQASGVLAMDTSTMVSSGLIHSMNSTVNINGSTISGLVSTNGECILDDTTVDAFGLTIHNRGSMVVKDVHLTSNVSFPTPVSAISSLDGGRLVLDHVSVNGSYDGGLFARDGALSARGVEIDLEDGLYGVRTSNVSVDMLEGLTVNGTLEGVTLRDSPGTIKAKGVRTRTNFTGFMWSGYNGLDLTDSEFVGSTYGGTFQGLSSIRNCTFRDNMIGLLAQSGTIRILRGNTFTGYSKWGVESESWRPVTWPDNIYNKGDGAISDHAWWGMVNVSVVSDKGFTVEGAILEMTTMDRETVRIAQGPVGMIWGWEDPNSPLGIATEEVNITAKWGTSSDSVRIHPIQTRVVRLVLVMSDLNVTSIVRKGSLVNVDIANSGPGVRDARVTVFVDGSYRDSVLSDIGPNTTMTFSFDMSDMGSGEREVTVRVFGRDEYSGSDGALMDNNERSIRFLVEGSVTGDTRYVLVGLCIMSVSITVLLIVIFLKRTGPKV